VGLESKSRGPGEASLRNHPNAIVARRLWEAVSKGDAETIIGLLSPEVTWRSYGTGELAGLFHGPEGVLDFLARAGERVEAMVLRVVDIFASDDGAVIHYVMDANQGPKILESQVILRMRIQDGLITEAFTVPTLADEAAAFWRLQ
jgi:ketosteroid isomerase-like protein